MSFCQRRPAKLTFNVFILLITTVVIHLLTTPWQICLADGDEKRDGNVEMVALNTDRLVPVCRTVYFPQTNCRDEDLRPTSCNDVFCLPTPAINGAFFLSLISWMFSSFHVRVLTTVEDGKANRVFYLSILETVLMTAVAGVLSVVMLARNHFVWPLFERFVYRRVTTNGRDYSWIPVGWESSIFWPAPDFPPVWRLAVILSWTTALLCCLNSVWAMTAYRLHSLFEVSTSPEESACSPPSQFSSSPLSDSYGDVSFPPRSVILEVNQTVPFAAHQSGALRRRPYSSW